ncbi:MAG TPA: DoxX family protein [Thermoanaerobaculia bacterium]|nr:DoxX family protein [Thermoanaerobaculia bacterium]
MDLKRAAEIAYLLLRVVAGWLFLQAGSVILFGWFGGMPGGAKVPLMSQVGIGGALEFVGGICIVLGLFTRPVAFILSGEMAVAYWQFHAPHGTWPLQNQGVPAVLFCFIFLYMAAQGGGEWSLDAVIRGRRGEAASPGR